MNFAPFNAHTTPLFKNYNILRFADIINVESFILINNCFNKDSQPRTHTILHQLEMVYCLFQVITQSDLGENQLFIQPLLHEIIFKTS